MGREGTVTTHGRAPSFIIKRPRLTKLLDESEARIILLVAPAGYGKTTLAREWLADKSGVAWYSGRPAMADVAALATGLISILGTSPEAEQLIERAKIIASRDHSSEALARTVIAAVGPGINTLVIDDCHHTAGSKEAEDLLAEVSLHTTVRVVLASRVRPAWIEARMLVYGDAYVLDRGQLAFTEDEARAVIGQEDQPPTNTLLSQAQGWPAVIGLAARQGGADLDSHLAPGELYDFFAEDLFRRTEGSVQRALMMLALGGDASPAVTSTLFGEGCEAALSQAADRGFLAAQPGVSELHPLLRAFLLQRLSQLRTHEAEAIVRETVTALEIHARWDECLSALESFPVPDLIVAMFRAALDPLLKSGRITTVSRWVQLALANHVDDAVLILAQAEIALRNGDDALAQALGQQAAERFSTGDSAARGYIVAARAALFRDDDDAVRKNATKACKAAADVTLRTTALWIEFSSATERSAEEAVQVLEKLRKLPDKSPDHAVRLLNAHSFRLINTGDVRLAAENCKFAHALLPQIFDPFVTTNILNLLGHTMVHLVEYEQALGFAATLLDEAESTGLSFAVDHALLIRAGALIGLRKLSAAQQTLGAIAARVDQTSSHIVGNGELQKVKLAIAAGDLTRASRLVEQELPESLPRAFWAEFIAHRGMVLAATGSTAEARRAIQVAQKYGGYGGAQFVCDLGLAIISLQTETPEAEILSSKILLRGIKQGQLDAIVTAGRAFPDLIRAGVVDAACARGLTRILNASCDVALGRRAGLEMPRVLRRSEPLSPREREVYELIVQGRSNREIATTLFISESTAKVHVRHIFDKLGVHTRAEAARAWSDNGS
jgi:ATP/maltotriose-dependent transcriptional regulator MalT